MRIVGGSHRGRRFNPPAKIPARPTTDLAKEGLFNTLQNLIDFEQIKTLDLFAGTGNISFELASRGTTNLTLVESDRKMIFFIQTTFEDLKFEASVNLVKNDVFKFLTGNPGSFDLIFADPPYALPKLGQIPDLIFEYNLLNPEGWLVLEHEQHHHFEHHPHFKREKKYGMTIFSFFQ